MSFKELKLNKSYVSLADNSIATSFLNPCLKLSRNYKRSVGFFSSNVINNILEGIITLAKNDGKIKIITSDRLSEEDVNAINLGYSKRKEIIENSFLTKFNEEIEKLDDDNLSLLSKLIANNTMDIKIAITRGGGFITIN